MSALTDACFDASRREPEAAYRAIGLTEPLARCENVSFYRCPLNPEHTWEFQVWTAGPGKGAWECVPCERKGDILSLWVARHGGSTEAAAQAVHALLTEAHLTC